MLGFSAGRRPTPPQRAETHRSEEPRRKGDGPGRPGATAPEAGRAAAPDASARNGEPLSGAGWWGADNACQSTGGRDPVKVEILAARMGVT